MKFSLLVVIVLIAAASIWTPAEAMIAPPANQDVQWNSEVGYIVPNSKTFVMTGMVRGGSPLTLPLALSGAPPVILVNGIMELSPSEGQDDVIVFPSRLSYLGGTVLTVQNPNTGNPMSDYIMIGFLE